MARFVHIQHPAQHDGITRVTRGFQALGSFSITRAALQALAALGDPLTRGFTSWTTGRKQRREDEQLWNLALTDARIMADLSRAMSRNALRGS
jgi:hypothetical protein